MQEYLNKLEVCLVLKWYSVRTQKVYLSAVKLYNDFLSKNRSILEISNVEKVKSYLLFLHQKNRAPKTINLSLFAIKFFYKYVLKSPLKDDIYTAKNVKKLPEVLSKAEVQCIFENIKNYKHRLLFMLSYGAWLRVSEVVNLKIWDLDFGRRVLNIRCSKWKKDRIVMIPNKIIDKLQKYIWDRDFGDVLFESERWGRLSTRTCQKIFKKIWS